MHVPDARISLMEMRGGERLNENQQRRTSKYECMTPDLPADYGIPLHVTILRTLTRQIYSIKLHRFRVHRQKSRR